MTEATYFCGECGEPMAETIGNVPYPQSGLSNVLLTNVPIYRCKNGHEDVRIPAVSGLNLALCRAIVAQSWQLKGTEIRFLRKFLGYSARKFSEVIGVHFTTLSRLENEHSPIDHQTDALIRLFCAVSLNERFHSRFPRPLIPVLEALEASTASGELQLRRVEPEGVSEPSQYWQETTTNL